MKKTIGDLLSRSHTKHTKPLMCFSVVVPLYKLLEFITIGMNITIIESQSTHGCHMLPKGSMVSLHFSIMLWSVGRVLLVFNTNRVKKSCKTRSKLSSAVCTNSCNTKREFCDTVLYKFNTGNYTLFGVDIRIDETATIIQCIILNFWT